MGRGAAYKEVFGLQARREYGAGRGVRLQNKTDFTQLIVLYGRSQLVKRRKRGIHTRITHTSLGNYHFPQPLANEITIIRSRIFHALLSPACMPIAKPTLFI